MVRIVTNTMLPLEEFLNVNIRAQILHFLFVFIDIIEISRVFYHFNRRGSQRVISSHELSVNRQIETKVINISEIISHHHGRPKKIYNKQTQHIKNSTQGILLFS